MTARAAQAHTPEARTLSPLWRPLRAPRCQPTHTNHDPLIFLPSPNNPAHNHSVPTICWGPATSPARLTKQIPVSEGVALSYFRDVLKGLEYLHFNGVMHGKSPAV